VSKKIAKNQRALYRKKRGPGEIPDFSLLPKPRHEDTHHEKKNVRRGVKGKLEVRSGKKLRGRREGGNSVSAKNSVGHNSEEGRDGQNTKENVAV